MGQEIERKYLLKNNDWKKGAKGTKYCQGYLSTANEQTVRVRIIADKGFLTIKSKTIGVTRLEYEYEIPVADANEMLSQLCEQPIIEKKRYKIEFAGLTWEVDEFFGDNDGLIVAEVELISEDQQISLPSWVGDEVSSDARYFNSSLAKHPFKDWK